MLSFDNLDAANRAHAEKLGTGIRRESDGWWFIGSFIAALLFGAFVVWLVMPRGVWDW